MDLVKSRESLPALIDRAAQRLAEAKTSAEVAEARKQAKAAQALAKVVGAAREVHADCLKIIIACESRLADEVDRAQAAGTVAKAGANPNVRPSDNQAATLKELNIPRQRLNEWRKIRDAPDVVESVIQTALAEARTPTKAEILEKIPVTVPVRVVSRDVPMFKTPVPYTVTHATAAPPRSIVVPIITHKPEPVRKIQGADVLQGMQADKLAGELTDLIRDWCDKAERWDYGQSQKLTDAARASLKRAIADSVQRLEKFRAKLG
jgi:hypothetical protein